MLFSRTNLHRRYKVIHITVNMGEAFSHEGGGGGGVRPVDGILVMVT